MIRILLTLLAVGLLAHFSFAKDGDHEKINEMVKNLRWTGQAGVKIYAGDKIIYIDPLQLNGDDKADIIFITHDHYDHLSEDDINKILDKNTIMVAPKSCKTAVQNFDVAELILLEPGDDQKIGEISVKAVPAYNIKKTKFHPKNNNWLGYIFTIDGVRIYHAGDTERIPEMKKFACDIALLPLGQTYTMNSVEEAADAALDVGAKIAIPIHFGLYEGTQEDAEKFKTLLKDKIEVIILKSS